MQIQINAPHEKLADALVEWLEQSVERELAHFAERLTRVEIHVRDQNAHKGGVDIRCVVEARPRGLDPLAGEADGASVREAFEGALGKTKRALEHRFGKQASH